MTVGNRIVMKWRRLAESNIAAVLELPIVQRTPATAERCCRVDQVCVVHYQFVFPVDWVDWGLMDKGPITPLMSCRK